MPATLLEQPFYARCPKIVARELLGKIIISTIGKQRSSGIVVETEAYLATKDPACHGARGQTPGNRTMFGPAGHAYVYPIHAKYCFNTVTQSSGTPSAVLIRAIEPVEGLGVMKSRRHSSDLQKVCSGPAKLCQALGIDQQIDGMDLTSRRTLWLVDNGEHNKCAFVRSTVRIGVTSGETLKLRYVIADSPFASGPKYLR